VGVLATGAFCFPVSLALFKVLDLTVGLRVTEEEEINGLDWEEHGVRAYGRPEVVEALPLAAK
jgi:Amt family ammonium transporter